MQDALRTYLELATGLGEASRKKVRKAVKDAVGRGNATAEQVRAMASELLATNTANREALTRIVRYEVDRALGAVGLATADEVNQLAARVRGLEQALAEAEQKLESAGLALGTPEPEAAETTVAKKAAGAKAPVTKAPVTKAPRTKAAGAVKKVPVKKVPVKKAPVTEAAGATSAVRRAAS